eukprot:354866-Chlamydomonas_euryale.AAC.2
MAVRRQQCARRWTSAPSEARGEAGGKEEGFALVWRVWKTVEPRLDAKRVSSLNEISTARRVTAQRRRCARSVRNCILRY